jgi:hypothetical protein
VASLGWIGFVLFVLGLLHEDVLTGEGLLARKRLIPATIAPAGSGMPQSEVG